MLELELSALLEALLLASNQPMTEQELLESFESEQKPAVTDLRSALAQLQAQCADRGIELVQVASGYRFQVKQQWMPWIHRLSAEKAPKYSRSLLETLALIAYQQPLTRGEIEDIRGVAVNTAIIRTLEEREWIRVTGHKEVPGRPALYGTTKQFLDYFGLEKLEDLPPLPPLVETEVPL